MKNLLRTTALLLIFNFSFIITKAQWVSIPDSNFGTWLNANGYTQCLQGNNSVGWQMDTTCNAVVSATDVNCWGQNITDLTGIQYFDNLRTLECEENQLSNLPALPHLLTYLRCQENQLSSLPILPNSLTNLDCDNNQLISLPALPNSLTYLFCNNNQLSSLPVLPDSLTFLRCNNNQLNSLPVLPNLLTSLYCQFNQLSSLPALPNSLTILYCHNNQLSSLSVLPNALTSLSCQYNQLSSLPALPNSLTYLFCNNNQTSSLPTLPGSLTYLYCNNNQLSSLSALPNSLTNLYCGNNQLSSLPVLPNSLTTLSCGNNQLSSLPALPDSLTELWCYGNQLTSLPALPNLVTYLSCYSNQLSRLPELPDFLENLNCKNNPNLFCLPRLKKVNDFYFTNTGITCLPNYPQSNFSSSPPLNTVPLCDIFNINGCEVYWNISGKVYIDSNANCLNDVGERAFSNFKVQLYQNGNLQQLQNTLEDGSYSFVTGLGTYAYSIDTANLPFVLACPDSGYYTSNITALDSLDGNMNFGLRCKSGFDLIAQGIDGWFRPGNTTTVNVSAGDASNFYSAHCAAGTGGSVQLIINGAAHYSSAASGALMPTSVVNDTITWSIADFGAVNFFHDFNINVATDTTAVLGSQICFTLIVNPIAGDNNPANNILTHCFTVVSSFDPNEKEVYPAGNIDTATHWLTYTIHFQNTGTAEAQHIYVTDTLDSNIDAASFQLLAYSYQPMVQLKGNNLRFNFPNINLPDSNTNEPASHGYVQYKVKLKDNLPIGTIINNTAFIYFDFNAPVVTNTTSNTIALATSVANLGIRNADFGLNPNPATESVRLSMDESMVGSNLTITDITGREVLHSAVQIRNSQFDIRNLSQGVYFVTIANEKGRMTKKLMKQ